MKNKSPNKLVYIESQNSSVFPLSRYSSLPRRLSEREDNYFKLAKYHFDLKKKNEAEREVGKIKQFLEKFPIAEIDSNNPNNLNILGHHFGLAKDLIGEYYLYELNSHPSGSIRNDADLYEFFDKKLRRSKDHQSRSDLIDMQNLYSKYPSILSK